MEAESKKEYIESWISYIKPIYALALNKDEKLSHEIHGLVKRLEELVPKVADVKKFSEE